MIEKEYVVIKVRIKEGLTITFPVVKKNILKLYKLVEFIYILTEREILYQVNRTYKINNIFEIIQRSLYKSLCNFSKKYFISKFLRFLHLLWKC
jgi:uncharacterized protein YjgD (DUF1641 family)